MSYYYAKRRGGGGPAHLVDPDTQATLCGKPDRNLRILGHREVSCKGCLQEAETRGCPVPDGQRAVYPKPKDRP